MSRVTLARRCGCRPKDQTAVAVSSLSAAASPGACAREVLVARLWQQLTGQYGSPAFASSCPSPWVRPRRSPSVCEPSETHYSQLNKLGIFLIFFKIEKQAYCLNLFGRVFITGQRWQSDEMLSWCIRLLWRGSLAVVTPPHFWKLRKSDFRSKCVLGFLPTLFWKRTTVFYSKQNSKRGYDAKD